MSSNPSDRRYTQTHEWFKAQGDTVTMGITQYAADELTDITFMDLPAAGRRVQASQPCGEIESVKTTSELISAVDGEIIEANAALAEHPELVNQDPCGRGWMLRIRCGDISALDKLMDVRAYDEMIGRALT